jgi:hypothetical protein
MKLGLYANILLTPEPAFKSGPVLPRYTRNVNHLEYLNKPQILKLSFASIKNLPITKMVLNIEGERDYSDEIPGIYEYIKSC